MSSSTAASPIIFPVISQKTFRRRIGSREFVRTFVIAIVIGPPPVHAGTSARRTGRRLACLRFAWVMRRIGGVCYAEISRLLRPEVIFGARRDASRTKVTFVQDDPARRSYDHGIGTDARANA